MADGGTFVRPGALAWGGTREAPDGAYSSCEIIEQVLAAAVKDPCRLNDLLEELARARLWVPLPADGPVTDGSAVALPTVTYLGAEFVPCFTSVQRLSCWPDRPEASSLAWRRSGDTRVVPHIVVPAVELARRTFPASRAPDCGHPLYKVPGNRTKWPARSSHWPRPLTLQPP